MIAAFHSYFSFRYGVFSLEEIVRIALVKHLDAVILCDINYSGAIPDFVKLCRQHHIRPLAGIDFRNNKDVPLYTGIAKNNEGLANLNRFLTQHLRQKRAFPGTAPNLADCVFVYSYSRYSPIPENSIAGVPAFRLLSAAFSGKISRENLLLFPLITGLDAGDKELHRHLRAIDHNCLLSQFEFTNHDEFVFPEEKIETEYYERQRSFFEGFEIDLAFGELKNKKTFSGDDAADVSLLSRLAYAGFRKRYSAAAGFARQRLEKELATIVRLGFTSYFLITWDIISYAKKNNIPHVGRGSGANSIVAYCLGITAVDPVELDLYFERFINPLRSSPPDFDLDFSWKDRAKIQAYIFSKYGEEYVALLGTVNRFQRKGAIRELGKVYGLPKEEIDFFVKHPEEARRRDELYGEIYRFSPAITNFPNMNSIHAGGVLISEKPVFYYTALNYSMSAMGSTQFDMFTAEDLGFEKWDVLSQRGIGHIREAMASVKQNYGVEIDIEDYRKIKTDEKTRQLLKRGETIGCFYVESPAMQGLIKKLQCDDYRTLVAASSIIRPGVAKSGMMRKYIEYHREPTKAEYPHPLLKALLEDTYGVMVYQEDVLKVCHYFAGMDLADADILRRGMSGKFRSKDEFLRLKEKFFRLCAGKGYSQDIAGNLWQQIESFAAYSFSKAHSASYAIESFQSLYLKAHYPLDFMVAVINNFGGFYPSWLYFYEARRWGAILELPDINESVFLNRLSGKRIYVGFVHIQNMDRQWIESVLEERNLHGAFSSFDDFMKRVAHHRENIIALIRLQAFRRFEFSVSTLLWKYFGYSSQKKTSQAELFSFASDYSLPSLEESAVKNAYEEIRLLGFPLSLSYFDMLQTAFRGEIIAKDMPAHSGEVLRMLGLLVNRKYIRTKKGDYMAFGFFMDNTGAYFDTVHFAPALAKYPFQGTGVYLLKGKINVEFEHPSLEVFQMARMPLQNLPEI